jgi:hypothetical protein
MIEHGQNTDSLPTVPPKPPLEDVEKFGGADGGRTHDL